VKKVQKTVLESLDPASPSEVRLEWMFSTVAITERAVENHLSMTGLVTDLGIRIDPLGNLGFDRLGE
jgi:hypothetical protein